MAPAAGAMMADSPQTMTEAETSGRRNGAMLLSLLGFTVVYLGVALVFLLQWGSRDLWARVDVFSGGVLLMSLLMSAAQCSRFTRVISRTPELTREAIGLTYDPHLHTRALVLSVADLVVFFDYGHWRLTPALEQPALQIAGLVLYVLTFAWFLWTDPYLARHFAAGLDNRRLIAAGPFRWVRHPRYLGVLATHVAFALAMASVLAWGLLLLWVIVLVVRIGREEAHLRQVFGAEYEEYSRRTARLLPGIY
jgi:protein-S-isoprenylcysteine O-methyltransferase Ste14